MQSHLQTEVGVEVEAEAELGKKHRLPKPDIEQGTYCNPR